jgi:hypothetical protein
MYGVADMWSNCQIAGQLYLLWLTLYDENDVAHMNPII